EVFANMPDSVEALGAWVKQSTPVEGVDRLKVFLIHNRELLLSQFDEHKRSFTVAVHWMDDAASVFVLCHRVPLRKDSRPPLECLEKSVIESLPHSRGFAGQMAHFHQQTSPA